jgi:hypothetical protein
LRVTPFWRSPGSYTIKEVVTARKANTRAATTVHLRMMGLGHCSSGLKLVMSRRRAAGIRLALAKVNLDQKL